MQGKQEQGKERQERGQPSTLEDGLGTACRPIHTDPPLPPPTTTTTTHCMLRCRVLARPPTIPNGCVQHNKCVNDIETKMEEYAEKHYKGRR